MPYFHVVLADSYGRQTRKRIEVETQTLLGDYENVANALAADLQNVTDLQLLRIDLVVSMAESFAGVAGSNIDVGATFSGYLQGGDGKKASLKLPGIKASLVASDGTVPITGNVSDYLDNWLTAGDLMLSDGETISAWISGSLDK